MAQQQKIPLIIDTDPGVDDVLAILLALASPEVDLQGITLTFGNTTLDHAYSNIQRTGLVLRKHLSDPKTSSKVKETFQENFGLESKEIPFAIGAKGPLGDKMFTAGYFHGRDGLSSISTLPNDPFPSTDLTIPTGIYPLTSSSLSSCDLILSILSSNPIHTVRIAAIGPLTNICLAFQKDPETFSRLGSLHIMGCAIDYPGNTTPVAEFNTFADPLAAKIILEDAPNHSVFDESKGKRGLKSFVLPLDITENHIVPYSSMVKEGEELKKSGILGEFISALLTRPRKVTNSYVSKESFDPKLHDNFQAHDPLAVAHAIFGLKVNERNNQPLVGTLEDFQATGWKVVERKFEIEFQGERTRGMCVVDRRNHGLPEGTSRNKAEQNKKEEEEEEDSKQKDEKESNGNSEDINKKPKPIKVVTESPGIEWFAKIFTERLGF